MENFELRVSPQSLITDNETLLVEGLVNKTESWSETLGTVKRFKEKIKKGVFAKAIKEADIIDFLAEHDKNKILATTKNDSLELWENEDGLMMRGRIAPTSYGRDFYTLIKEGIIAHMSFGFSVTGQEFRKLIDGTYERTITGLKLFEVSAVRNPAYANSAISARNLNLIEEIEIPDIEEEQEERKLDNEVLSQILEQLKTNNELLSNLNKPSISETPTAEKEVVNEPLPKENKEPINSDAPNKEEEEVKEEEIKKDTSKEEPKESEEVVEDTANEVEPEPIIEDKPKFNLESHKEILNKVLQGE